MDQAISGDDWDHFYSKHRSWGHVNPACDFRRRLLLDHLRRLFPEGGGPLRLLDVGCGTGEFAGAFREAFPTGEFLGIDASAVGVEICRREVPSAAFERQDLVQPEPVDPRWRSWATAAVCSEVLEHIDDPAVVLENIKPYLAPGAPLIVTVPGGPMSAHDHHIGHRRHFTKAELQGLLERCGYQVRGTWGAGFPFFNLYRLLVLARGKKAVDDASRPEGSFSLSLLAAKSLFEVLFRLSRYRSQWGWQRVALATAGPGQPPAE